MNESVSLRERFRRKYNFALTDPRFLTATDQEVRLDIALEEAFDDVVLQEVRGKTEAWNATIQSPEQYRTWQERHRLKTSRPTKKAPKTSKLHIMGIDVE